MFRMTSITQPHIIRDIPMVFTTYICPMNIPRPFTSKSFLFTMRTKLWVPKVSCKPLMNAAVGNIITRPRVMILPCVGASIRAIFTTPLCNLRPLKTPNMFKTIYTIKSCLLWIYIFFIGHENNSNIFYA